MIGRGFRSWMIVRMWNIGWFGRKGRRIDFSFLWRKKILQKFIRISVEFLIFSL